MRCHRESLILGTVEPGEIRTLRRSMGMSQAALGNELDVSQALVSMWETGGAAPGDRQVERLLELVPQRAAEREAEPHVEDDDEDESGDAFGEWLLQERSAAGLSRAALSDASGVSSQSIYNIETGRTPNPRDVTRQKLEEALGTQVPTEITEAASREATIEGLGEFENFDPHDNDAMPREPGIYVFYDAADHVLYVGESSNVRNRIVHSHREKFWYHSRLIANASFVRIDDERLRKQIERTLIKFLKSNAVLNQQNVERD